MRIGILALQGGFAAHRAAFAELGCEALRVRHAAQLPGLDGLVIPGGESTTLLKLMADEPWAEELVRFHAEGGALLGTCAGAILLATQVRSPVQPSLGLLDATVERNAYGRQIDSFEAEVRDPATACSHPAVFIRAPRFRELGPRVHVLAELEGEPVLVREGRVVAATFHPELTSDRWVHHGFLTMARFTQEQSETEHSTRGTALSARRGEVAAHGRI